MGVPNYCPINTRVEIVRREEVNFLMIFSPTSVGGRPPFIFSSFITSVPKSGMLVGAGAIGASKVGGALYASLLRLPRFLTPHFNLAREFSFLAGGRRFLNFIGGVLRSSLRRLP